MTPIDLALLLGLATLWGGSYFFIRVAVPAFGPAALVALRVVIGGLLLWTVARATRRRVELRRHLPRLAILGLLNAALPYLLISAAELHLTASFAAILGATVPLFAAALGARYLGERLSVARIGGLLMGVVGVAVMVGWGPMTLDAATLLSVLAMLAASASYAGAGIYTKLTLRGVPTFTLALGQQLGAFVWLALPGALLPPRATPSFAAIGALLALGALSTAVAYLLYFRLLERVGPTKTTTVTYLIPIVGMLGGALVLHEPLTRGMLVGLGLVLGSVLLVNEVRVGAWLRRRARVAMVALAFVLCGRVASAAMVAQSAAPSRESARVDIERALPPMRGDRLRVSLVEVTYAPGASSLPHAHRCPVVGHVVSGALRTRSDGDVEHVYRAGESFTEDAGQAHLVSANASSNVPVTFLVYFVCDGDGPRSVALAREIPR